jgi:hypothetical protein
MGADPYEQVETQLPARIGRTTLSGSVLLELFNTTSTRGVGQAREAARSRV